MKAVSVRMAGAILLALAGCANRSFTPVYPGGWSPLSSSPNACRSIVGCYNPRMPHQEITSLGSQSPYGEENLARAILKLQAGTLDTNQIKSVDASSVCVSLPEDKTVQFKITSPGEASTIVFDKSNSEVRCEGGFLTVTRHLYWKTFLYDFYLRYTKSLLIANSANGELVVQQRERALGIPMSGQSHVWSKYGKAQE